MTVAMPIRNIFCDCRYAAPGHVYGAVTLVAQSVGVHANMSTKLLSTPAADRNDAAEPA